MLAVERPIKKTDVLEIIERLSDADVRLLAQHPQLDHGESWRTEGTRHA